MSDRESILFDDSEHVSPSSTPSDADDEEFDVDGEEFDVDGEEFDVDDEEFDVDDEEFDVDDEEFDVDDESEKDEGDIFSASYENVIKSKILTVGGDLYVYNFFKKGIKLLPITPKETEKNQAVYVSSINDGNNFSKLTENHLLVIQGPAHTGKRFTALNLAGRLSGVKILALRFTENASLMDFLEDEACPKNCVFLIHDAFQVPGIDSLEIIRYHSQIELLLKNKNDFGLLTTDFDQLPNNDDLPESILAEININEKRNLEDVLKLHLVYHKLLEDKKLTKTRKDKILNALHTPYEIDRFCQKLLSDKQEFSTKRIEQILISVTNTELEAKEWFSNLSPNIKYYALLAALFEGIDSDKLWQIFEKAIEHLRRRTVKLEDPYNFSEEDLQNATETEVSFKSVHYKSPYLRDYVLAQVRNAYRHQFRYLLPVLSKLVLEHSENKESYFIDYIDTRIILASGIGEIGKSSWKETQPILYNWAKSKEKKTRTCVAHALRRKGSNEIDLSEVKTTLEHWKKHRNPRVRWTVAASWERLYPYDETATLKKLSELAEDKNDTINRAVAHALVSIARRDADKIINWLLLEMINSENAQTRKTAAYVFSRLLSENRYTKKYIATTENKKTVLPLVKELFVVESAKSLERGMRIFRSWIDTEGSEINQIIENTLINVYATTSTEKQLMISQKIKEGWKSSKEDHIYRFSVILLDLLGAHSSVSSTIAPPPPVPSEKSSLDILKEKSPLETKEKRKHSMLKGDLLDYID